MKLIITLQKEVANETEAQQVYDTVKQKLADTLELSVSAHTSKKLPIWPP